MQENTIHWILYLIPTSVSNLLNISGKIALECLMFCLQTDGIHFTVSTFFKLKVFFNGKDGGFYTIINYGLMA